MRHDSIDPGRPLASLESAPLSVGAWMSTPAFAVRSEMPIGEARHLMAVQQLRHLPVIDGCRHLVGIVSDRDLRSLIAHGLPVERVMTAGPMTTRPETRLDAAARLMTERRIGSLPVVDDGRLVGILTRSDVMRAFVCFIGQAESPAA